MFMNKLVISIYVLTEYKSCGARTVSANTKCLVPILPVVMDFNMEFLRHIESDALGTTAGAISDQYRHRFRAPNCRRNFFISLKALHVFVKRAAYELADSYYAR